MIIFMQNRKITKILLMLIVLCMAVSCKDQRKEFSLLRDSLSYGNIYSGPMRFFPLKLHCRETNDTIWSITSGGSLYNQLNISFCAYETFAELLADKVEKNGYLTVDSILFNLYRQYAIEKDVVIDSIYQEQGVRGILENYITKDGELAASTIKKVDYLLFLLYQHRILCDLGPDPAFVMFVYFYATGKEEEYMKVLESSKSTMYICPFYLSGKDSLDYINELKMNGEAWKLE